MSEFTKKLGTFDWSDLLVVCGTICLGIAVGIATGWVGVLGFAGAFCLILGLILARR